MNEEIQKPLRNKTSEDLKKRSREYYYKNREKVLVRMKQYNANLSDEFKEKVGKYRDNWDKENRDGNKDKAKRRYREDRVNYCKKVREYRSKNKEKIRNYMKNLYYQEKELWAVRSKTRNVFKELKVICEKCGSKDKLNFHHPKPHRFDNFMVLCFSCHLKEHGREKVL